MKSMFKEGLRFQTRGVSVALMLVGSMAGIHIPLSSARADFRRLTAADPANSRRATSRIQRCKVDGFQAISGAVYSV